MKLIHVLIGCGANHQKEPNGKETPVAAFKSYRRALHARNAANDPGPGNSSRTVEYVDDNGHKQVFTRDYGVSHYVLAPMVMYSGPYDHETGEIPTEGVAS